MKKKKVVGLLIKEIKADAPEGLAQAVVLAEHPKKGRIGFEAGELFVAAAPDLIGQKVDSVIFPDGRWVFRFTVNGIVDAVHLAADSNGGVVAKEVQCRIGRHVFIFKAFAPETIRRLLQHLNCYAILHIECERVGDILPTILEVFE